jgi:hypothetical protein
LDTWSSNVRIIFVGTAVSGALDSGTWAVDEESKEADGTSHLTVTGKGLISKDVTLN